MIWGSTLPDLRLERLPFALHTKSACAIPQQGAWTKTSQWGCVFAASAKQTIGSNRCGGSVYSLQWQSNPFCSRFVLVDLAHQPVHDRDAVSLRVMPFQLLCLAGRGVCRLQEC